MVAEIQKLEAASRMTMGHFEGRAGLAAAKPKTTAFTRLLRCRRWQSSGWPWRSFSRHRSLFHRYQ